MIRAIAAVLLTLFLAGCVGYKPLPISQEQHEPVWNYDTDPYACMALKGSC
jgi:hypothetical protein